VLGASESLGKLLAEEYVLFVNSATPEAPLKSILKGRRMERYFQNIFGGPTTKNENLRTIFNKLNIQAQEMVFVGDHEADQRAAADVRCHFIGVKNKDSDFKSAPLWPVKDLVGLVDLIKKIENNKND